MIWDLLMGAFILFSVVIVPYRMGFGVTPNAGERVFDMLVDIFFFVDILFCFNTAYVDPVTEVVVTDRRKIAWNYIKLWFWIDLFSTIPFDTLVGLFVGDDGSGGDLAALRLIKILRLTRMLKLLRVIKLSKVGKLIDAWNINPALVGVQKLLLQICFMAHLVACFWHMLTLPNRSPNWISEFGYSDDPVTAQYVSSFYWTISTMLTIGYGDISGTNGNERLYCIFTMLLGGVMFGAVISQVTRLIESRNPQARAFKEKMDEVKAYLNEKVLPLKLKGQIKDAYAFYLTKKSSFGESGIFEELPPNLLNRLVMSIYSREVHRINLFKICDENLVVKLVIEMKPFQALPGMKIIEKGDVADEVIFILRGLVQFTTIGYTKRRVLNEHSEGEIGREDGLDRIDEEDGEEKGGVAVDAVTGYSTEGGYFGDYEYYKRTIRMVTHRAMCNCSLMSLPTVVLDEALPSYPLTNDKLNMEFEQRYQNFVTASKSIAHKRKGFRIFVKETMVIDGCLQNIHSDGSDATSEIYSKRVNSSNAVLEVHRTVALERSHDLNMAKSSPDSGHPDELIEIHAEEHSEDLLARYLLLPKSDNKIKWDLFVGILIIYSVIVIPVEIGFQVASQNGLQHFNTVVDLIFGIDMLLSLRTCYYDDKRDAYVVTPRFIYRHYLRTWFFIDFFSVFPFELILAGTASSAIFRSLKLIKVIRLVRLLKLARLAKLRQYLARLEDSLGINPATFELLKMLLEVAFIGHLVCCLYWALSWNLSDYSWFDKMNLRHAPLQSRYVATIYWTFTTLSTVGYGDITPVDTQGKIVTICVMVMGGTVFGYIVANVSSLMSSLDVTASRMNDRIAEVSEYLIEKNASVPLSESILKHVKYMFTQNSAFDERTILSRLPFHLCRKMILLQHSDTLSKITLFHFIENKGIILYLFRLLIPIFYDSLHYLCLEGTLAHEIVFIVSGKANVYKTQLKYKNEPIGYPRPTGTHHQGANNTAQPHHHLRNLSSTMTTPSIEHCDLISQLQPGDFFGHMSMMLRKPYQASVRTFMPSSVYTLTQIEISKLLRNFPAVAITLQGALALAISQSQSNNKQYHRVKRAEFLNSLGTAYVTAKAQMALRAKEVQRGKSSTDLLANFRRLNSTESDTSPQVLSVVSKSQKISSTAGGGGGGTASSTRRSSISMMFGRTKSSPVGFGETEFSKIPMEDDAFSSQASQGFNPEDSPDDRKLNPRSRHLLALSDDDDEEATNGREEKKRDGDSGKEGVNLVIISHSHNADSKEEPLKHEEADDEASSEEGATLVTAKSVREEAEGGISLARGPVDEVKYLTDLPILLSKPVLPPLTSPVKFPKKKNLVTPVDTFSPRSSRKSQSSEDVDSDEEGNAMAIHDSSLTTIPQKLKPLPSVTHQPSHFTKQSSSVLPSSSPDLRPAGEHEHQGDEASSSLPQRNPNSKWNLLRAVIHDPAAMAIIQQQLESSPIETQKNESITSGHSPRLSGIGEKNMLNVVAHKGLGLLAKSSSIRRTVSMGAPPPVQRQIVRRSSSIAAVVRASIANRKRQRVMLLLAGNELYDSDEDKQRQNPYYLLKLRAQEKRNRSCPNLSALCYEVAQKKSHLNQLKRRVSFPSLDYELNQRYVANQFYL